MVKLTQKVRRLLPKNGLSVLDHFVGLALKEGIQLLRSHLGGGVTSMQKGHVWIILIEYLDHKQ